MEKSWQVPGGCGRLARAVETARQTVAERGRAGEAGALWYNWGMAYIRKTRTGSGATAVQICWKKQGEIVRVEHIGSAKTATGVEKLLKKARGRLDADKNPMFDLTEFDNLGEGEKR